MAERGAPRSEPVLMKKATRSPTQLLLAQTQMKRENDETGKLVNMLRR